MRVIWVLFEAPSPPLYLICYPCYPKIRKAGLLKGRNSTTTQVSGNFGILKSSQLVLNLNSYAYIVHHTLVDAVEKTSTRMSSQDAFVSSSIIRPMLPPLCSLGFRMMQESDNVPLSEPIASPVSTWNLVMYHSSWRRDLIADSFGRIGSLAPPSSELYSFQYIILRYHHTG
jgi:hypothetical protein